MAVLIRELRTRSEGPEEDKVGYGKSILKRVQALNCLIRETRELHFIRLMVFPLIAFVFEEVIRLK